MSAPPKVATKPAGEPEDWDSSKDVGSPRDSESGSRPPCFILALDVGTTCVRSFVLDEQCVVRGSAVDAVSDSIFK